MAPEDTKDANGPEGSAESDSGDSNLLDAGALDDLLSMEPMAEQAEPDDDAPSNLSEETSLDDLLGASSGDASETASSDDIEALLAQLEGGPSEDDAPADAAADDAEPPPVPESPPTIEMTPSAAPDASPEPPAPEDTPAEAAGADDSDDLAALLSEMENQSAAPPEEAPDQGLLSQDLIDSLVTDAGDDEEVAPSHPDEPVVVEEASVAVAEEASIAVAEEAEETEENSGGGDEGGISQDMLDALVAAAGGAEEKSEVGSENIAAAATAATAESGTAISGTEVVPAAPAPAPAPEEAPAPRKRRAPSPTGIYLRQHLPRVAASLAAGLLAGLLMFTTLYVNQERVPDMASIAVPDTNELTVAMKRAEALMASGGYARAIDVLEGPVGRAYPGAQRLDAEHMLIEARYRDFSGELGDEAYQELQTDIDALVKNSPDHPRAPQALRWKAKLYERDDFMPYAAQSVYDGILQYYTTAPVLDGIILDAAKLANRLDVPLRAAEYIQRLLHVFPDSPHAPEARLVLGDAYAKAGQDSDARTLYIRTAQADPYSRVGAEAFLRLGRLAFNQGDYAGAIRQLETRLETATSIEGNDAVYLLLAEAYRYEDRLEDAQEALNDLLTFFPETEVTPAALVALSQVLDELGERPKALQTASKAAVRFPNNPDVLRNNGEFLGLEGNAYGAAAALIAANDAGADDPDLLLTAARHLKTASLLDLSEQTYGKLRDEYPGTAQALTGTIEQAVILYEQDRVKEAVEQLENSALATENTPYYLPTILAMARIYGDLGLDDRVASLSEQVASLTTEPAILVESAMALLDAGAVEEAQTIAEHVDLTQVPSPSAYELLMSLGEALLVRDPRRGLQHMETAHLTYPGQRTLEDDQRLLETYLGTNRPAAARRMVMELAARVRTRPIETPNLIDAAVAWGDYLYEKGDFRAATEAYTLVTDASDKYAKPVYGTKKDPSWAKYQKANALLALADFESSLPLFAEVAESSAPWAQEAGVKAEYARLERRMRGASSDLAEQS